MVLLLTGMRSNVCRERLAEALAGVTGVADVNVSLMRARATIVYQAPCCEAALIDAVRAAGYIATVETRTTTPGPCRGPLSSQE
jgi:copper chaperone CopZ